MTPGHELTRGGLLARNIALNFGGWLLPAIAALVAMPFLVAGLGDARFGVLALAWTTLGYFSLFDLGLGRAVTHAVAGSVGDGREEEIGGIVWTSLGLLFPVGMLGAAALFLAAPWLATSVLRVPVELEPETIVSFRLLAAAIPFTGGSAALRGVLEARQLFGAVNALRVPHGLLTFLGPLAVLPFSRSLVPAVAIITVGRVALFAAYFMVCARAVPHFAGARARWNMSALRPLLSFGGWMTVSNVISPLMNSLDRFVVGAVLSVAVVTYYATPSELVTKMWLFTAAIHPVFFPAISTTGLRDPARSTALFDRMLRLTFAGLLIPTLVFVTMAPEILAVWLGPAFAAQSSVVLQVLAIAVFVNTLGQGGLIFIHGMGRPDLTGKFHLAELPFYAVALWLLLPRFGIAGVAIAWAARAVVDALLLLLACPALLKETRPVVTRTVGWLAAAVALLFPMMLLPSTTARVVAATIAIPLVTIALWKWVLTAQERAVPAQLLSAAWRPERA